MEQVIYKYDSSPVNKLIIHVFREKDHTRAPRNSQTLTSYCRSKNAESSSDSDVSTDKSEHWANKGLLCMDMCNVVVEGSKKGGRPMETGIATSQSGPGRTRYREWTCVTWRGQRREAGPGKLA